MIDRKCINTKVFISRTTTNIKLISGILECFREKHVPEEDDDLFNEIE